MLKFIKIGIRHNLLYPFMFMIFVNILYIIEIIFYSVFNDAKLIVLFPLLMFLSNFVISAII